MEADMDVRVFDLPTCDDDVSLIERRLTELERRARNGEQLDEIELDWMDTANTWLMAVWSNV
jgi:hypothetical protein